MSTPIQPVPDVVLAPEFPTLADRPAGLYNQKAAAWANGENPMSIRNREIAVTAHNNATAAKEQAQTAQSAAATATAAADAASQTAGATEWISGQAYPKGATVWSPLDMQTYRRRVAGAGALDPSLDPANWTQVGGISLDDLHANALSF